MCPVFRYLQLLRQGLERALRPSLRDITRARASFDPSGDRKTPEGPGGIGADD